MRKSKIDQASATEFSIGVPVSARRQRASIALTARAFFVLRFLMCCASSMTSAEKERFA